MVNIIETHSRDNQLLLADYKLNIELQALDWSDYYKFHLMFEMLRSDYIANR